MKLSLRDYQLMAKKRVRKAFCYDKRVALVSPTGSGKTVIATSIIESTIAKGNPVLFIAHRKEIIDQTSKKLKAIGLDHGVIMGNDKRYNPESLVQVASIQTLLRRDKPEAKLVIMDECHTNFDAQKKLFNKHYPDAFILGLTASPWRVDGRGLGRIYQNMVVVSQVRELVKRGFLVDPKLLRYRAPNLSKVKVIAGDYSPKELSQIMNKPRLVYNIVRHWWETSRGLKTVIFASSVPHSKRVVEGFNKIGVRAEHLDCNTDKEERNAILERLRTGETTIVSNVGILTEGWDLPSLECLVLARPTKSLSRYLQMVGRVMRPSGEKRDAVVLDHAGCFQEHGIPTRGRNFSLNDHKPVPKPKMVKRRNNTRGPLWIPQWAT